MFICKNGNYLQKDIYKGRNSNWFDKIRGNSTDASYFSFPNECGISEETPLDFKEKYKKEKGYYDFYYISVEAFKNWFKEHRPDIDAGWVSRYDAWAYENKNIYPEVLCRQLYDDDIIEDRVFIEVIDKYDSSAWLFEYLMQNNIPNDAIIQYCFDR